MEQDSTIERARGLRLESQPAERKLWNALRNRQLRGCKFRRQHPIPPYFADFACVDRRLFVELDGPQHGEQEAYDGRRTADMDALGWAVLRFENGELDHPWSFDRVLTEIGDALDRARD